VKFLLKAVVFDEYLTNSSDNTKEELAKIQEIKEGFDSFLVRLIPIIIDGLIETSKLENFKELIT